MEQTPNLETVVQGARAVSELRAFLLQLTFVHATQRSSYYRDKFHGLSCPASISDLAKLPLLEKVDLQTRVDEMRAIAEFPDYLMYTSGTTGRPLEVPVYDCEVKAFNDIVLSALRKHIAEEIPLSLVIMRVGHGTHILTKDIPSIPCHINYGLDQFFHFLETDHWYNGRRVRIRNLEVNVLNLRQITKELLEKGIDPTRFGLETIAVSGWYISRWEREFLSKTWGVVILDRYGVTEVNGDAKWCHSCEHYHFDFMTIPEVLDPDTGLAIEEGFGHMVLTGLYPFNQAIPKIRYFIGDVVKITRTSCGSSEPGIRFLSRLKDAVRDNQKQWIFSSDIAEVISDLPDIARKEKTGFLKFKLAKAGAEKPRVSIELVYPPSTYPSRVADLQQTIMTRFRSRRECLGQMEIVFVGPGQLTEITKL